MRLTKRERDIVVSVIAERLAGGWEDLRDALGMSEDEAEKGYMALERALDKLNHRAPGKRMRRRASGVIE